MRKGDKKMAFADNLELLDGERLSKTAKATVQATGRLNFAPETASMMNITADSTIVLFKAGERDLGAIVKPGEDRRGFKVKKTGPYFYIQLKNYLDENSIDYRGSTTIMYDITKLSETYEDLPLFKMIRREITHDPKVQATPDTIKNVLEGTPAGDRTCDSASAGTAPTVQENA